MKKYYVVVFGTSHMTFDSLNAAIKHAGKLAKLLDENVEIIIAYNHK